MTLKLFYKNGSTVPICIIFEFFRLILQLNMTACVKIKAGIYQPYENFLGFWMESKDMTEPMAKKKKKKKWCRGSELLETVVELLDWTWPRLNFSAT